MTRPLSAAGSLVVIVVLFGLASAQFGGQVVHVPAQDPEATAAAQATLGELCRAGHICTLVTVFDVQQQVVAGIKYYLGFAYAEHAPTGGRDIMGATAEVYVPFSGEPEVVTAARGNVSNAGIIMFSHAESAVMEYFGSLYSEVDISLETLTTSRAQRVSVDLKEFKGNGAFDMVRHNIISFDGYFRCQALCDQLPEGLANARSTFVVTEDESAGTYHYAATLPLAIDDAYLSSVSIAVGMIGAALILAFLIAIGFVLKSARV
uniref:Uncharacterized protein n=1 Tax=Palpitomonas bilix TaxID=652834 RepID=A0A7S3G5T6_9EUKA